LVGDKAQPLAAAAAVERRRNAELDAFRPDRVVVVRAVDAEDAVPHGETARLGVLGGGGGDRPRQVAAEHPDFRAELLGDEFELFDRFLRRVHRDDRRRGHAVAEIAEIIGRDDVVGADHGAPGLVILDPRQPQPGRRIDHREIGADLVEALVEQLWHHRGRPVERVLALAVPEIGLCYAPLGPLGRGHLQPLAGTPRRQKAVGRLVAADLAHLLGEDRRKLDPVTVAVDDRVLELCMDLGRAQMAIAAHVFLLRRGAASSEKRMGRTSRLCQMQRSIFVAIAIYEYSNYINGSSQHPRFDHALDLSLQPPSDPPISSLLGAPGDPL
jgi:hypothetical protein